MQRTVFQTYCFKCEKKGSAATNLVGEEFWQALENGADIEVIHLSDGDHLHDFDADAHPSFEWCNASRLQLGRDESPAGGFWLPDASGVHTFIPLSQITKIITQ
jgi:hypothetical protein